MQLVKDDLISIVIPVFNVELYIEQCLESISNQSYKNIEIILINDGSEDKSGDICETWTKKDVRIRYFKQDNIGLGYTRNRGISLAKGRYITFIDSDDWVHKDYIKEMYFKIIENDSDICASNFRCYNEISKSLEEIVPFSEIFLNQNFSLQNTMCTKLYKKDIFTENKIKMPKFLYEDLATYPILELLAKKIVSTNSVLYYYRVKTGTSIMDNLDNVGDIINSLEYLITESKRLNLFYENKESFMKISVLTMKSWLKKVKKYRNQEEYFNLKNEFKVFLNKHFYKRYDLYDKKLWVWGSYNLSRVANYLNFEYSILDNDTTYYGFSSIVSLMGKTNFSCELEHNNKFRLNMLKRDFNKKFRFMEIKKDDYIIIDFLEERYDLIRKEESYLTKSEVLEESKWQANSEEIIKRNSIECDMLWKKNCLEFIQFLKLNFELEKIILVEMYLCEEYLDGNDKKIFQDDYIVGINTILSDYYSFFKERLPQVKVINNDTSSNYADINFMYGCKPYYVNGSTIQEIAYKIFKYGYNFLQRENKNNE